MQRCPSNGLSAAFSKAPGAEVAVADVATAVGVAGTLVVGARSTTVQGTLLVGAGHMPPTTAAASQHTTTAWSTGTAMVMGHRMALYSRG